MRASGPIAAFLLALASPGAPAGVLYKSVDARGTVMFSDVPPPEGSRIVEQRVVGPGSSAPGRPRVVDSPWGPFESDPMVEQANARLDQAERAFALARRDLWSVRDGLRLETRRRTPEDEARVRQVEREWREARRTLLELRRASLVLGP